MERAFRQLRDRFRRRLATITASVLQAVCVACATGSRFRIAKDVPVLRVDHAAVQVVLPGVRKVARASHVDR